MNEARQYRLGTGFTTSFPDFPGFTEKARSFRLIQEAGKQDILQLVYVYQSPFYLKALKTGVPVILRWRNEKGDGVFHGYVYEVKPLTARGKNREVLIKATGATLSAKETANKIWVNKSATQIVEEIAKKLKLKTNITPSNLIFSQQSMINHTYWEKIQELARRTGYLAQVYGTELNFHPIDIMINKAMTKVPIYEFIDAESPRFTELQEHNLDEFKPTVGDLSITGLFARRDKNISSVDPYTAKSTTYTSSPSAWKHLRTSTKPALFKESLTHTVTSSPAMTRAIADANSKMSSYSIFAEGKGQGDAKVAPYRTIEVKGTGEFTDGYWVITRVEHSVTWSGKYEIEFTCMTDGVGKNKETAVRPVNASSEPTRDVTFELKSRISSKSPTTILSSKATMINQTSGGFKVTPRRWVGR